MWMSEIRVYIDPIISMTSLQMVLKLGEEEITASRIGNGPKLGACKTIKLEKNDIVKQFGVKY